MQIEIVCWGNSRFKLRCYSGWFRVPLDYDELFAGPFALDDALYDIIRELCIARGRFIYFRMNRIDGHSNLISILAPRDVIAKAEEITGIKAVHREWYSNEESCLV